MRRKTLFVLTLLIVSCACTRTASTLAPRPSPTSEVRLCSTADLQTSSNSNGATGSIVLGVTLVNSSKSPCVLVGPPQVTLTVSGRPLDVQIVRVDQASPSPTALTISPGESAIVILIWRNYCGAALADGPSIQLALTTGQTLDIKADVEAIPRCDAKNEPSTLTVNPYSYPP